MTEFWLCFVPLFVAVDSIGILPMFMSLTEGLEKKKIQSLIVRSVITAIIVAISFLFLGKAILSFLGITIQDFMIAGGILLFVIAMSDLLSFDKRPRRVDPESIGVVPIAIPLIVGPGVLTTVLLLAGQHGFFLTALAAVINILLAGVVFLSSPWLYHFLGQSGAKAISKIASLLLASIAVMMIRKGIMGFLK